jgi:hypothetical protein
LIDLPRPAKSGCQHLPLFSFFLFPPLIHSHIHCISSDLLLFLPFSCCLPSLSSVLLHPSALCQWTRPFTCVGERTRRRDTPCCCNLAAGATVTATGGRRRGGGILSGGGVCNHLGPFAPLVRVCFGDK